MVGGKFSGHSPPPLESHGFLLISCHPRLEPLRLPIPEAILLEFPEPRSPPDPVPPDLRPNSSGRIAPIKNARRPRGLRGGSVLGAVSCCPAVLLACAMGAPKQRWTPEEEAALKAGVAKHGPGKWRTILRDSEFSALLRLRSNVDLKDKWRNLSVTAGGYGSREKARMALKKGRRVPKVIAQPMDLDTNNLDDVHNTVIDAKPLAMAVEPMQLESSPDKSVARLDDLILEAIKKLKESSGSNKTAIAAYIEEQYWPPDDFQLLLSTKLKALVATGKLIKVNQKYRIAPSSISLGGKSTKVYSTEDMNGENNNVKRLTKPQVDAELDEMKGMTKEEAAAFAAKAVAEAEVAITEAEEAAKVAEAAEAEAEAAKAFLDAVMLTVQNRNAASAIIRAC